jgi:hypothetical protein
LDQGVHQGEANAMSAPVGVDVFEVLYDSGIAAPIGDAGRGDPAE